MLWGYEEEAVAAVQGVRCGLHQAHLHMPPTCRPQLPRYFLIIIFESISVCFSTFDPDEHELVERQSAVVGHNICGLHTAQVDLAEVLLAGEARQGHVGQIGVFGH